MIASAARGPLAALALLAAAGPAAAQAPDLHLVLVADTDEAAANAGPSCKWAAEAVLDLVLDGKPAGKTVQVKLFAGRRAVGQRLAAEAGLPGGAGPDNFAQDKIRDYLRAMPCGPNTRVVFYYMGHGAYAPEPGHVLMIPPTAGNARQSFATESVLRTIQEQNPNGKQVEFLVTLSESCASPLPRPQLKPVRGRVPGQKLNDQPAQTAVRQLFFEARGVVQVNGTRQLDYGFFDNLTHTAPPFTFGLIRAIKDNDAELVDDADKDGFLTWREILPRVMERTRRRYEEIVAAFVGAGGDPAAMVQDDMAKRQVPQAFKLAQYAPKGGGLDPPRPVLRSGITIERSLGLKDLGGARVVSAVAPAADSIRPDDVIREVNGLTVRDAYEFESLLEFVLRDEQTLRLKVRRGGELVDVELTRVRPN
jgi:hypothetical protein